MTFDYQSLADIKVYLRVDWDSEDDLISHLQSAAETYVLSLCRDFTAEGVPEPVQQAIMLLAAHFYENRQTLREGKSISEIPFTVSALISNYREYFEDEE